MRISDWSSDVCSSDLGAEPPVGRERLAIQGGVVVAQEAVWPARLYFTDMPGLQHAGIVVAHDPKLDMGVYFAVGGGGFLDIVVEDRSEEQKSELQSLMRISYAVFCLKKKKNTNKALYHITT